MNGIIKLLYFKEDFEKYFLKNELYNVKRKIQIIIEKPIKPVSVKISK